MYVAQEPKPYREDESMGVVNALQRAHNANMMEHQALINAAASTAKVAPETSAAFLKMIQSHEGQQGWGIDPVTGQVFPVSPFSNTPTSTPTTDNTRNTNQRLREFQQEQTNRNANAIINIWQDKLNKGMNDYKRMVNYPSNPTDQDKMNLINASKSIYGRLLQELPYQPMSNAYNYPWSPYLLLRP